MAPQFEKCCLKSMKESNLFSLFSFKGDLKQFLRNSKSKEEKVKVLSTKQKVRLFLSSHT